MTTIHAIRSKRVVTPEGIRAATVHVRDGVIEAIAGYNDLPSGKHIYDAGESIVMPGLVDTHVHINEPGRTDWEGFETATRAAAAGGVTTLIDMPLNSIPATKTAAALETKREAARGKCWVNVGFWGGVVPGNAGELRALHRAGAFGFKCFLVPSGVPEFAHVGEDDLRAALPELAALNAPLLVHAELPGPIEEATNKLAKLDPRRYRTWLTSRPPSAEIKSSRDDDSPCPRIQSASPHRSSLLGTFRAAHSAREKRRRAHHNGNLPPLSIFHLRLDSEWANGIQVRPAHPGFAKLQKALDRSRKEHHRFRCVRPFSVTASDEMPGHRRFF